LVKWKGFTVYSELRYFGFAVVPSGVRF